MSFADDINRFTLKLRETSDEVFVGVAQAVHESVVEGSPVTGAPGQPVDTGNLKNSWQLTFPERGLAQTATNVVYAEAIEEGQQEPHTRRQRSRFGIEQIFVEPRPMVLRSQVGGFHSVKLTRAGFTRLVRSAVQRVRGGAG